MEESPSKVNMLPALPPVASLKRPAPSLLPAFEPLSSSPGFPRPSKRQALYSPSRQDAYLKYPTPLPTSATGILSSSPPRVQERPTLHRAQSMVSERAPLSTVPTVVLPADGDVFLMGRSSNSSHYQLSANKLISRIHVKARYIAARASPETNKVEIICNGWNGMKVHCHGRSWDLAKGDTFTSETESAEIMLDIQDARVFISWPLRRRSASESASSWDDEDSPRSRARINGQGATLLSSPLRMGQRLVSPESPTPAGPVGASFSTTFCEDRSTIGTVDVYEDANSDEDQIAKTKESNEPEPFADLNASQSSELSEASDEDPDEENDPIVHSFGPFGANISSRMAAVTTSGTPEPESGRVSQESSAPSSPSPIKRSDSEATSKAEQRPFVNHVVNQLAFSRLSSTPLSVILNNLPADLRGIDMSHPENRGLTKDDLHRALVATSCIGEIHREGKDAAGKTLESEYYYIPDEDVDENRRAAVVDGLRKPSLRNCRKSHKQYYWKKPRTP